MATRSCASATKTVFSCRSYVNQQASSIVADDYLVPLRFPSNRVKFRGGSIIFGNDPGWDAQSGTPIVDREARHKFSFNTCNACHYGETSTDFTHVGKAPFGTTAPLSAFLTGEWVPDPFDGSPVRFFDDLERRAVDMEALISESCFAAPVDVPVLAESH